MTVPVIVMAKRTPVGKMGGMFKTVPPEKLAAAVIKAIIEESGIDPAEIDEVIFGNAVGPGGNIARLSLLTAGLPEQVPGVTVDRQCGSGLEAVNLACRLVQSGAGDIYIAGGVESTSLAPWKIEKPVSLYDMRGPKIFTRAKFSPDTSGDPEMGEAAENVAEAFNISREEQDWFAWKSHQKAVAAMKEGRFQNEIVEVNGFIKDECPKEKLSLERLAAMKPVFKENGTVTVGNSCPLNDGACAVLVMSERKCKELKLKPALKFVDCTSAGVDPKLLGIGPVPAVQKLLARNRLKMADIDLVEFNEAFASQVLASAKELNIPQEKLNVGGGALAIGHPYGASGAILVARLCTEMKRIKGKRAIATLGIGGGLGIAALYEEWQQ